MLFPVRMKATGIITDAKINAVETLEQIIGHDISYSSIAPSILHAFEIRDFIIMSADEPDEYLLSIERLRLDFNLFRFRRDNPMAAFRGLLIVNSTIDYNSEKNTELTDLMKNLLSRGGGAAGNKGVNLSLPEDFSVRGRNIDIRVETGYFRAELTRLFFSLISNGNSEIQLSLKSGGSFFAEKLPDAFPVQTLKAETQLRVSGRIDPSFSRADLDLDVRNFKSNIVSSEKMFWNIRCDSPSLIRLTKTGDSIPLDLAISADLAQDIYDISLDMQDFIFNRYFTAEGILADYAAFGESSVSGNAELKYSAEKHELTYSGKLAVLNVPGLTEGTVSLSAEFSGDRDSLSIKDSDIRNDSLGRAAFTGDIGFGKDLPSVNGRLRIPGLRIGGYSIASLLEIRTDKNGIYIINAAESLVNGLRLSGSSAELFSYGDNIEFNFDTSVITAENSGDRIHSEGIIQLGRDYYIQALVGIDQLLAAPVVEALPGEILLPEIASGVEVTSELYISGTPSQLSFASPEITFTDRSNEKRRLSLSVSGNNSGVRISDIDLNWDNYSLKGNISSDLSDRGIMHIRTDLNINGTGITTSGVLTENGNLTLTGNYGLKFSLLKAAPEGLRTITLSTSRMPVKTSSATAYLSLNAAGYFGSPQNWKVLLNSFKIEDIPTGFGNASIDASALFSQSGGNFFKLGYSDPRTSLHGNCSLIFDRILPLPEGKAYLNLSSVNDKENYSMVAGFGTEGYSGDIRFSGFPFRRLKADFPVNGDISGTLELAGTLSDPQFRLNAKTGSAVFNNSNVSIGISADYKDLNLVINNAEAEYGSLELSGMTGTFNLAEGVHEFDCRLRSEGSVLGFSSNLLFSAETAETGSILDFPGVLSESLSADITADNLQVNLENKSQLNFRLVKNNNEISITGGAGNEINLNFFEDGYFSAEASAPFPVKLSASGTLKKGQINATVSELRYVFDDMEVPYFKFYKGELTGRMRIQGPVNDPDFFGQLDFHDFVFKPPIVEDITEPLTTSFFLSGKELTIPATRIKTNNGTAFLTITASMERWLPRTYDIKLNVPEGEEISALYYWNPFYVYGFCSGQIHLYGSLSHMFIEGDLNALEGVFMVNSTLDIKSIGSPTEFITSDLNINVRENNQFFWPNRETPIVKGFLSPGNRLSMRYDNSVGLMLNGNLALRGGEIFYFERSFYIKEGEIKFNNDTLNSMDPLLSTRAEIRDVNAGGELTKIYLVVDQSPLSSFSPRFESDPVMSTAEIISMLGGNIFNTTFEDGSFRLDRAALLTADLVAQFTVLRSIEDGLKSSLGLDLLSIRSSFISNFLENAVFGGSGEGSTANFARYLDNTTLFLGKYFTDDIFLQGMFQFDLYNDTGYSESPEMNIDSEIKLEWEGPVANVEISFYPDFADPLAGLYQTSLGLSWSFSY